MEYLVTASEMKQYDTNTIEYIGIPGMVLMERAALETLRVIEARFGKLSADRKRVFILAGTGNNGGDGLALARLLAEAGYAVTVKCVGNTDKASEQWKQQRKVLSYFPVQFSEKINSTEYTIMVDALFGVGLSRDIEGEYAAAIQEFNEACGFKLALDIPSGIHSDTGRVMGCSVCADMTVTFGFIKRGLVLSPGKKLAGEVVKVSIGISEKSFLGKLPELYYYDEEPYHLLPERRENGNKGTFGKVLLIAGNEKTVGAALLSAKAAYRTGAGMVKVISDEANRNALAHTVPEALFGIREDLEESMKWADVIAIGPGLGLDENALFCLNTVIYKSNLPLIIDADGLNLIARETALRKELTEQCGKGRQVILTPHVGELSRLTDVSVAQLKESLFEYGRRLAKELHIILVAKDARTYICREEGLCCVNICGNSGMATAGSGDVLTGIIAGLLAQGMNSFDAAAIGVYLHGKAGDRVAGEIGEHACMAGDLIKVWI